MHADGILNTLLDKIADCAQGEEVSVGDVVEAIGPRAFPALILLPALIVVTPASGIPGFSSIGGLTIALITAQYIAGRKTVWLPQFVISKTLPAEKIRGAVRFLRKPSRWIDSVLKPRLSFLAQRPFSLFLALVIMVLGLVMPLLELVPFTSSILAGAISFLSLSLLFRDGLLSIIAAGLIITGGYLVYTNLLV